MDDPTFIPNSWLDAALFFIFKENDNMEDLKNSSSITIRYPIRIYGSHNLSFNIPKLSFFFRTSRWEFFSYPNYDAKDVKFSQTLHADHILLEPKSRSAYCYIHKVASSTWMKLFTNVHKESKRYQAIIHFGQYYKYVKKFIKIYFIITVNVEHE